MEARGRKGELIMYHYVEKKQVDRYKSYCQDVLNKLQTKLKEEYSIVSNVMLIGSGAEDMVTRNGKGAFDLDYNLVLTSIPQKYENSPEQLRNRVREALDSLVDKRFSHGKGSTSSLTYLAHARDRKKVVFKFDVALIREKEGMYKLVHDKGENVFIWNEVPHTKDLDMKIAVVKRNGRLNEVREIYLDLKNMYLRRNDKSHPSFVVYAEAVNQVYHVNKTVQ